MKKMKTRKVNICDICNVERAKQEKEYRAGTCYVKLSAVDESVGQIKRKGLIDSRYAALEPKEEINTEYMHIAIARCFPKFLKKYRTTINLQFETLTHFSIDWHDDTEVQEYVVDCIKTVDDEIRMLEQQIQLEKEQKRWYLEKMMI